MTVWKLCLRANYYHQQQNIIYGISSRKKITKGRFYEINNVNKSKP